MVFSKDVKPPVATSLSTVPAEAGEREQQDLSLAQPGPSGLFRARALSSQPSLPHNGHSHAWEVELETRLLEEMRVVMLLPVKPAMTALQDMLRDETPASPYPEALTRIVSMLNRLVDQLANFHAAEKTPTTNQHNAQRDITHLVTRVPAALIATMQVSRDRGLLPRNPSPPDVYWAVEKANAVQEEVRELGDAFKNTSKSLRTSLMSLEIKPLRPMIDLAKELGAALLTLESQMMDDQDAYSTAAQRDAWTKMRDGLKGKAFPRPETVVTRLIEIEQLRDTPASDNKTMAEEYRALSALIDHILDTRVQNPRELHAVNMLATLALDIAFILPYTAGGSGEPGIEGSEDAVTAPGTEKALTDAIGDIDAARRFLNESWKARALKNAPLFKAIDTLDTLEDILSSMKVNVSQQIPLYEREQRRVSLETLRETLTSTVNDDPKTSGEWGVDALIRIANTLLWLESAEGLQGEAAVITFERTLGKVANGVRSAMAMRSVAPEGTVTAEMLKYAKSKAEEGAKQTAALTKNFVHGGKETWKSTNWAEFLHVQFEDAAVALENARHRFPSKTILQSVYGTLRDEGERRLHTLKKAVLTVLHAQSKHDKWKATLLPSSASPVAADVRRNLRACIYPVVEALTLLKMAAGSARESRKFNKHYGATGRSKDAKYDAASLERYRQASADTARAFPWVQEKITVLRSTLLALSEQSGDAETTAVVQELMAAVSPSLADFDTLHTEWEEAGQRQSGHKMDVVIRKIGAIKSAITKAAELSVGAPQGIHSDESKRVRHLGAFLADEKAKHLAEHPQEGGLFDEKVRALLQRRAPELASARDDDMAQRIRDAYIDAANNMQLHLPTTEDVVKGVPGFWTKLAGSGPMAVVRRVGKMAASGSADMLFFVTGTYQYKVALSISLKTLMFAYSLYRINDALERARKPWEPEDVTTAARWAVTDTLFRQHLFRIAKTAQPVGALKVLLPVGQTAYLLTRADGTALVSEKVTVGKVADEAGWLGGSEGVSRVGEALADKGSSGRDSIQRDEKKIRARRGVGSWLTKRELTEEIELAKLKKRINARKKAEAAASNQTNATGNQHGESSQENISSPRSDEEIRKEIQETSNTLEQLNQPILNSQQRIEERIAAMINQYNEGTPKKSWLTPNTPVIVTVTSKKRIKASAKGAIVKIAQNISPDYRVTFALKDVMSGQYKYKLDRLTGHKLSDYAIVIQKNKRITEQVEAFIDSVDRNDLQSSLQDETDQYFDNPHNAKGFSKVMEGLVKMRVLAYLDEHGDGNEFGQHLSNFYAGKIPAHDLYIDGVRVPGVFSFKTGEGIGSKTLVLNIYTNESFIFETKKISGRAPGISGASRHKYFPVDDMVPPSAWDGFNKMVQKALPLYEQRKYTDEKNPFRYKIHTWGAPRTVIEFKSGSYRDDLSTLIMNDIKNKIKQDYDSNIYSNTEQMFDYGMLLASKIITPVSLGAGAATGPLGFLLALGIDTAYVVAKFTQAEMSDNPTESDEIKSEALWESVLLGAGVGGETAKAALKSYRGLKPRLRKILNTMGKSSNTKPNTLPPTKVEVPSTSQTTGANINKSARPPSTVNNETKTVPGQSLSAVTETLANPKSPVIEIANDVTERAIPNTKGQRYIYQLGETGGEKWELFENYVKSSRSRHDIPAENVFGELTANRKSAIFNTPQPDSLSKLTKNDRLDIPVHGSSFGPSDAGSKHLNIPMKNYPAKQVADKLYKHGLREVGILRIDSCNLGDGRYLDDLKRELDKLGIKFGYLCAPNGYLQAVHLPGTNIRPVWTWSFREPWRVVKGNTDVNFPGTKYNSESV